MKKSYLTELVMNIFYLVYISARITLVLSKLHRRQKEQEWTEIKRSWLIVILRKDNIILAKINKKTPTDMIKYHAIIITYNYVQSLNNINDFKITLEYN